MTLLSQIQNFFAASVEILDKKTVWVEIFFVFVNIAQKSPILIIRKIRK